MDSLLCGLQTRPGVPSWRRFGVPGWQCALRRNLHHKAALNTDFIILTRETVAATLCLGEGSKRHVGIDKWDRQEKQGRKGMKHFRH